MFKIVGHGLWKHYTAPFPPLLSYNNEINFTAFNYIGCSAWWAWFVCSHPAPNRRLEHRHWAGAVHYSNDSPDLSPCSWNITRFRALTLSLLPFSRRPIEPVFLPPSSWCLHHTPDGSACLKNIYPFSLNVTDTLPSVHILTTSMEVAWWLSGWHCHLTATRFHSRVFADSLMLPCVCVCFLPPLKDQ